MTTNTRPPHERRRWTPMRKAALAAGLFYIATFVFSIPARRLCTTASSNDPDFVLGAGSDSGVLWGGLFEILTALTGIGTAVALYPVVKRHSEPARARASSTTRILEAADDLRRRPQRPRRLHPAPGRRRHAGTDPALLTTTAQRPGGHQGLDVPARARRHAGHQRPVPRHDHVPVPPGAPHHPDPRPHRRPAPAHLVHRHAVRRLGAGVAPPPCSPCPIAAWEFSLGVYMTVKGFKPAGRPTTLGRQPRSRSPP